ncbi:MAG: hypothetical protein M3460_12255 [Actinomycetota bacterium]|nr:hypothetical protein [Actinomycetota bacterium]
MLAEANEDVVAVVGDLVGGHDGDPGLLLAEQQQAARQPVRGRETWEHVLYADRRHGS